MMSATASSVPSPPSTSTRSTWSAMAVALDDLALAAAPAAPLPQCSRPPRAAARGAIARARRACRPRRSRFGLTTTPMRIIDSAVRPPARAQVQQELAIAFGAGDRRLDHAHAGQSYRSRRGGDLGDDARVDGGIGHQTALADVVAPGLELRLDQRHDVGAGREQRRHDGQDVAQRDERDVDRDDAGAVAESRQIGAGQVTGVDAFDDGDARVAAQFPVDWPWPTSSATTWAAPRCSSTSVKPPVDAPMSSPSRPVDVDREKRRARARA